MLAQNLRAARDCAGLTQEHLAVRAGLATATIQRIERGQYAPRVHTLDAIAGVLGCTSADLLTDAA